MSGEEFVVALVLGFAAFVVLLVVQIINRERWAIPIAVTIGTMVLLVLAMIAYLIYSSRGV